MNLQKSSYNVLPKGKNFPTIRAKQRKRILNLQQVSMENFADISEPQLP